MAWLRLLIVPVYLGLVYHKVLSVMGDKQDGTARAERIRKSNYAYIPLQIYCTSTYGTVYSSSSTGYIQYYHSLVQLC